MDDAPAANGGFHSPRGSMEGRLIASEG